MPSAPPSSPPLRTAERYLFPLLAGLLILAALVRTVWKTDRGPAQDFSLPVVSPDGRSGPDRMSLGDQRGKVVLLDFWATWCQPCAASTPVLVRLAHRFRDRGLVVVGINVDERGPHAVPFFMRRFNVDYPVVYDDGDVMSRYDVHAIPTLVLVDRQGHVRLRHTGGADESDLADEIEDLL